MSQIEGGGGLRVSWHRPVSDTAFAEPLGTKQTLEEFTNTQQPFTVPPTPALFIDGMQATRQTTQKIMALIGNPSVENAVKREAILDKMQPLVAFAKRHPFLTAGFLIALILVLCTTYLTIQALLGHTSITLFMAHPEIGAGLSFMGIYYSVYLINLCRRAKMSDDLAARVLEHHKFHEEANKAKSRDITQLTTTMNSAILDMAQKMVATDLNLKEALVDKKNRIEALQNNLTSIKEKRQKLQDLLVSRSDLSPESQKSLRESIEAASVAIEEGSRQIAFKISIAEELPELPFLELETGELTLPLTQTEEMKSNQSKQKRLAQKLYKHIADTAHLLNQYPGTKAMWGVGIAMCLLAGVGLYFYFHGATNLYFFGTLSVASVVSMMFYGINLLYEGYNHATIKRLSEELKQMEKTNHERRSLMSLELQQLDMIQRSAISTFKDFAEKWNKFLQIESDYLRQDLDALFSAETKNKTALDKMTETLFKVLEEISDIGRGEVNRIVNSFSQGATHLPQVEATTRLLEPPEYV